MGNLSSPDHREKILQRLRLLTPQASRRWGTMNVEQMLCHISDQLRMGLGDIPPEKPAGLLRFWPLNTLAIHFAPWPKGAPSPSEAFTAQSQHWDQDLGNLESLIDRFGKKDPDAIWPTHSIFGKMSGKDWGVLSYRHLDHHFRQFGI